MLIMFPLKTFLPIAALLVAAMGCGAQQDGFDYQPVTGKVTMDGEPLAGATVAFIPQSSALESGRPSTGMTDESGMFTLTSMGGHDGAVVGDHVVSISTKVIDMNTQELLSQETIPRKYNDRSELRFTVPASGTNAANFELDSSKKTR